MSSSSSETLASPLGDPALPITWTTNSISTVALQALLYKQTTFKSHYLFVSTCLQHNIIRRGLNISTRPCVPKPPVEELATRLQEQWSSIIRGAATRFLKVLKTYHLKSMKLITDEIARSTTHTPSDIQETIEHHERLLQERRTRKFNSLLPPHLIQRQRFHRQHRLRQHQRRRRNAAQATATASDDNLPSTVVNLSGIPLSEAETSLLSKGLSFCPTPPQLQTVQLENDLESYFRRLRLREFFLDEETDNSAPVHPFKPLSSWMPPKGRDQTLETYIKAVRSDTLSHTNNTPRHRAFDNLRPDERQALKSLRSRSDIVIKPADKGSAVVVQSKEDYLVEAYRQLNDTSSYQKLPGDLTATHSQELKRMIIELFHKGVIDKHTKNFLLPRQPRPARFYMLPKIHKAGNPGRPIVSSNGASTENISAFVDYHLRPLAPKFHPTSRTPVTS